MELAEIPCPSPGPGQVLIQTRRTVISAGTERMLLEFGKANLIGKARQHPDRVKQVLHKMKTDGVAQTIRAVRRKLDQPIPLGYSNAGVVMEVGSGVVDLQPGDRVVSSGAHAEVVAVSRNLVAKIPDGVSDEEAAFTVLGAIALQGVRLAAPTLGERFVVTGLGLLGLLAVQVLRASGCRVLGIDFDPARLELAKAFGADVVNLAEGQDPLQTAEIWSSGAGVDGVLLTLAGRSSEPLHEAAQMCRKRGRIVLVGVTGLELQRSDFYEKELSFQVSCSYGPGRYDPDYEQRGNDYPIGFVRWTAQRNFEAFLGAVQAGSIQIPPLISHRIPFSEAENAYQMIAGEASLGIVLEYPSQPIEDLTRRQLKRVGTSEATAAPQRARIGVIGAGSYAQAILLPAFQAAGAEIRAVASQRGLTAALAARKFKIPEVASDPRVILDDPTINTVVIATRHESHARYVCAALEAGKHVFVEKPLALSRQELEAIEAAYRDSGRLLMVGFNRRFAPHVVKLKSLLQAVSGPKSLILTVNAGRLSPDHWISDSAVGGGRLVGEGCHFLDLAYHLIGTAVVDSGVQVMEDGSGETCTVTLKFAEGSVATVHYFSNGHMSFPKERVEAFAAGRIARIDNFRTMVGFGWPGLKKMSLRAQDKGQSACVRAFLAAVEGGGSSPIPFAELLDVAYLTLECGGLD